MNAHGAICAQIDIIVAKIKHPLFDANSRRRQVFFVMEKRWETRYVK